MNTYLLKFYNAQVLSQNAVTCDANMEENSSLLQLCLNACYSPDPFVAVKAITILSRVACYWYIYIYFSLNIKKKNIYIFNYTYTYTLIYIYN